jgi:hypothetical protein
VKDTYVFGKTMTQNGRKTVICHTQQKKYIVEVLLFNVAKSD